MMVKLKPQKTFLVTDAVKPTGTDLVEFQLESRTLYVRDGKCLAQDGTLGGAYLTMNEAVRNCVTACKISLE